MQAFNMHPHHSIMRLARLDVKGAWDDHKICNLDQVLARGFLAHACT